jgi:hypothetical protein
MTICYPETTDWTGVSETWLDELDPAIRARAEALAWTTLQALTGHALTICPTSVRPCSQNLAGGTWYEAPITGTPYGPFINARGQWINSCTCGGMPVCSCGDLVAVMLPGPVGRIIEVKVDGEVVPATAYRVDDARDLVRTDGDLWPIGQDMSKPDSEPDTFSVTYFRGHGPDELTDYAAGRLAHEFAKAMKDPTKCKLPAGVTAITRQGVTMEINPGLFPDGYTGIREVDAVIMALNPHGLKQPSRVGSPDTMRRGRVVTFGAR